MRRVSIVWLFLAGLCIPLFLGCGGDGQASVPTPDVDATVESAIKATSEAAGAFETQVAQAVQATRDAETGAPATATVTPTEPPLVPSTTIGMACEQNNDCANGELCRDGVCVIESLVTPTPKPAVVALQPVADASLRDGDAKDGVPDLVISGSVIQALDGPGMEDRAVIEFDISSLAGPVSSAALTSKVFNALGPFPFTLDLYGYTTSANGLVELNDWSTGSLIASINYAGENEVDIDVTAFVNSAIGAGEGNVGFRFEFAVPSAIELNGPYVAFNSLEIGPAASLELS